MINQTAAKMLKEKVERTLSYIEDDKIRTPVLDAFCEVIDAMTMPKYMYLTEEDIGDLGLEEEIERTAPKCSICGAPILQEKDMDTIKFLRKKYIFCKKHSRNEIFNFIMGDLKSRKEEYTERYRKDIEQAIATLNRGD